MERWAVVELLYEGLPGHDAPKVDLYGPVEIRRVCHVTGLATFARHLKKPP